MTMTAQNFDYLRDLLARRSAIVLKPGKEYLVEARLSGIAREVGLASVGELLGMLETEHDPTLKTRVVEAMTTNETSWFRDPAHFDALREHVIPELIERRATERQLTFWSAACSSGQEPYSIAILLREHFPDLAGWSIRILATDLSAEILDQAQRGRFSQLDVNRGLPAPMLVKWFRRAGVHWEIDPALRAMVEFRQLNLVERWAGIPAVDVLLLRNVLIYFDDGIKRQILGAARRNLRTGGYLLLGTAETTRNLDDAWERVTFGRASCYREREAR